MTTIKVVNTLLISALLASATANAADQSIVIAIEELKQVASFKLGDFRCVVKESQVRCTK